MRLFVRALTVAILFRVLLTALPVPGDDTRMENFADIFKGSGERLVKMPSNYASNVHSFGPEEAERDIFTLSLDPSVAPVWTVVVLSRPRDFTGLGPVLPTLAVGRLYLSGGGGGGVSARAIPFDTKSITFLTVPASLVRISISTDIARIPGVPVFGEGEFSAYAVPYPIGKGEGAFWTEFTGTTPAGATAGGTSGLIPVLADAVSVFPSADAAFAPANMGAFQVNSGIPLLLSRMSWGFPSAVSSQMALWLPIQAGAEGSVTVTNTSGAPARYTIVYRMRI